MATAPYPNPTPMPPDEDREMRIISHSSLFYWWPVWAVGFLMSAITFFSGHVMAVVPAGTEVAAAEIKNFEGERVVLVLPKGEKLPINPKTENADRPHLRMSPSKNLGVLFCTVLLLVIIITNVPLRGLWSVIVIIFVISLSIIFALLGWWESIMLYLSFLDIRINLAGYFVSSSLLFIFWVVIFVFFDRQIYMVFTPGQFRVRLEIGDAETAYDTTGMSIQKQRSDLFRHWILGLGSGDLIVRTSGAQAHHFDMPNVLFLGRKVKEIEEMLRSRTVVSGNQ
jgi:hypothetical protein